MKIDMVKQELKNRIGDFVQDEAKAATVVWLKDKALPAVQDVADAYTAAGFSRASAPCGLPRSSRSPSASRRSACHS